ncbi:MAG: S4 domain-containing protein [Candidatus Vidania fulgoroideorum]
MKIKRGKIYKLKNVDFELFSNKKNIEKKIKINSIKNKNKNKYKNENINLKESIKIIKIYYKISKKQINKYIKDFNKKGCNLNKLIEKLEMRIDNVLFRSGLCSTRSEAKQNIIHKNIKINNKIVYSPSFITKIGDYINFIKINKNIIFSIKTKRKMPNWIIKYNNKIKIINKPKIENIKINKIC